MLFITVAVLPAVWTTMIVFGRGYDRAFGIGAVFPAIVLVFFGVIMIGELRVFSFSTESQVWDWDRRYGEFVLLRLVLAACWMSELIVGLICMGVRWLLEKRRPSPK
jgi:hypothetical protein